MEGAVGDEDERRADGSSAELAEPICGVERCRDHDGSTAG
jgi:hypothetical protein